MNGFRGSIAISDTRPPITAGPIDRAFKLLKSTSVSCGGPLGAGEGVTADESGGVVAAALGEAAAAGESDGWLGRTSSSCARSGKHEANPIRVVAVIKVGRG